MSSYNPTDMRAQAQRKQANEVMDRAKRQ